MYQHTDPGKGLALVLIPAVHRRPRIQMRLQRLELRRVQPTARTAGALGDQRGLALLSLPPSPSAHRLGRDPQPGRDLTPAQFVGEHPDRLEPHRLAHHPRRRRQTNEIRIPHTMNIRPPATTVSRANPGEPQPFNLSSTNPAGGATVPAISEAFTAAPSCSPRGS